jgi:hypothetical protein
VLAANGFKSRRSNRIRWDGLTLPACGAEPRTPSRFHPKPVHRSEKAADRPTFGRPWTGTVRVMEAARGGTERFVPVNRPSAKELWPARLAAGSAAPAITANALVVGGEDNLAGQKDAIRLPGAPTASRIISPLFRSTPVRKSPG